MSCARLGAGAAGFAQPCPPSCGPRTQRFTEGNGAPRCRGILHQSFMDSRARRRGGKCDHRGVHRGVARRDVSRHLSIGGKFRRAPSPLRSPAEAPRIQSKNDGRPGTRAAPKSLACLSMILRCHHGFQAGRIERRSAALNDPVVGRTLQILHSDPAKRWTIDDITREVGSSRSVVADRFKALLGRPPIDYVTGWRSG